MFVLYDILVNAVVWVLLVPWQLLRDRTLLRARLGHAGPLPGPTLVLHAVSAGEVNAAHALLPELRDAHVVVTVGNQAGWDAARRLPVTRVCVLPWDRRAALRRWLRTMNVEALAVVETEIWPNLFRACHDEGVRLVIVNGRVIPRDVARYRLARSFFRRVLSYAAAICVQNEAERDRFVAIGADPARVHVTGNLKVDVARESGIRSSDRRTGVRTLIGGSTHAPEEDVLLRIHAQLRRELPELRLLLAPRDVTRAPNLPSGEGVTVIDRVGLLATLYAETEIAFIGGTLAPIGGHNFLEAVAAGAAVIVGPHTGHIESLLAPFRAAGAIAQVRDEDELLAECRRLLQDGETRRRRVRHAAQVLNTMEPAAPHVAALLTRAG